MKDDSVYLDFNATTPVAPEVLDEMLPWFGQHFWNSASTHSGGNRAAAAVETSRETVGNAVGGSPREIIFTSGATEANNLAIIGALRAAPSGRRKVIVGASEHKSVLDVVEWLATEGADVAIAPIGADGLVDLALLDELLDESVAVVSIMLANNETGIVAPIERFAETVHRYGALFHTDATQAVGKIPVDLHAMNVDLASLSAHKMYGPKGIGALFVSRGTALAPIQHGGGHEHGLRSGTLNVPGIVGFGSAASLSARLSRSELERQSSLVNALVSRLSERIPETELIGKSSTRLPNTANIRFRGANGDAVMANAPQIQIASGSACSSMIPAPSHVLTSMGFSSEAAEECLRFSLGRPTQMEDIDRAVEYVSAAVGRVRELESGIPLKLSPERNGT